MANNNNAIKKTLGRRKIEIKKIEKKTSLQVTFTKRRVGLFRKASELTVLCGAEIAILVQSPAERIFAFGHPSVEALIDRFEDLPPEMAAESSLRGWQIVVGEDSRSKYEEAARELEIERRRVKQKERAFWWDEPHEGLELHELEEYLDALHALRDNVAKRVEELEMERLLNLEADLDNSNQELLSNQELFNASANLLAFTNHDQPAVFDYDHLFNFTSMT